MKKHAKRALRKQFTKTLVRGGTCPIWHWPAMPPECPVESYSVATPNPSVYGTFPTLQQAVEFADRGRCPLLGPLPFHQQETP